MGTANRCVAWRVHTDAQVELPYRYLVASAGAKEPLMPPGMRDLIYKDFDRTFEF